MTRILLFSGFLGLAVIGIHFLKIIPNSSDLGEPVVQINFTDRFGHSLQERSPQSLEANATAFVKTLEQSPQIFVDGQTITTTLHPSVQMMASEKLNDYLETSRLRPLQSGEVFIIDHQSDEVLAYVSTGESHLSPGDWTSALEPFIYAMALERGYTGASLLPETSKTWTTLREALYRKAQLPLEQIIGSLGPQAIAWRLKDLGISQSGQLNLPALVGAYASFARGGIYRPLKWIKSERPYSDEKVFSDESATIINDILSKAEMKDIVLPEHTAGFSVSRQHEGIALLYNFKYVVGVWLSDLVPAGSIDASRLPILVAKSILNVLTPTDRLLPLPAKGNLVTRNLCREGTRVYQWDGQCSSWTELMPGTKPQFTSKDEIWDQSPDPSADSARTRQ